MSHELHIETRHLASFVPFGIFVCCPRCRERALLRLLNEEHEFRMTCSTCAKTQEWLRPDDGGMPLPGSGPLLAGFELELWLQTPSCGHTLWAYNAEHVDYLDQLISAKLRERSPHQQWGRSNTALDSRLPRWMLSASNREKVSRDLHRLRELLS